MVLTETPDYSDRILKYNCNLVARAAHMGGGGGGGYFPPAPAQKGPLDCLRKIDIL